MSQTALWAVMRAYNIPDVDLLEVIYGRTRACMDSDDAESAIISFLTGVIQGGASSPRIFIIFINALLEHLVLSVMPGQHMQTGETQAWRVGLAISRESVLFIGTQFSILYTFMYSPA